MNNEFFNDNLDSMWKRLSVIEENRKHWSFTGFKNELFAISETNLIILLCLKKIFLWFNWCKFIEWNNL